MKTGPGFLIAAAFIGPGTVTTATLAGAQFGYALLWAVLFSILATMVLQEMAARLGIVTGMGLAEALNQQFNNRLIKWGVIGLIVCAIGIGNAAYEAGNLTGAAIGLTNLLGGDITWWCVGLGCLAALFLNQGNAKTLPRILTLLVLIMSFVFVITFLVSETDYSALFTGLLVPRLPDESLLTAIALVGTTVVPYNLFLHASLASRFQPEQSQDARLRDIQKDSAIAISLGGLVTLAVVSTAAAAWFVQGGSPDMHNIAQQLRPLLGDFAPYFFSAGLFCAGLTSAITAPLATSYALCGAFGWPAETDSRRFKLIWLSIILIGTGLCFLSIKPLTAILLAQAANGLLLPFVALCLLWFCNQRGLLGAHRNKLRHNMLAALVVFTVMGLGGYKILSLF